MLFFFSVSLRTLSVALEKNKVPLISNSTKNIVLSELRGEIYDCNMEKLVNRYEKDFIVVQPQKETAELLENYLEKDEYKELLECIEKSVPFVADCEYYGKNKFILKGKKFERYTSDGFCCHVLGYINKSDNKGVYGIEKSFDAFLKDKKNLLYQFNTTAYNKVLAGGENRIVSENYYSPEGVRLTIDKDIQLVAENALRLYSVERGGAVVLDAETGQIKAMASTPYFDCNNVSKSLNDENSPFLNRVTSAYSVGSVFKIVVAMAAVKEGKDDFQSFCSGSLTISGKRFACSDHHAHGFVNLQKAFAYSCNTYFIRLALELGKEKIIQVAENTGFGKNFSLAEGIFSSGGNLPSTEDIVTDGDLANLSFGQGQLLATPLQVALCYSVSVNGGKYISPRLVLSLVNDDGSETEINENQYVYRALSEEQSEKVKKLLENNFNEGTCISAKPENIRSGGKTSTAQTGRKDENGKEILNCWFAGFAEKGDAVYTIVVFKEKGKSGAGDCGPVFREIARRIENY